MKKITALVTTLALMTAALTGCGNTAEPSAAPEPSQTVQKEPAAESSAAGADTQQSAAVEFENKELSIAIFEGGYGPDYWNEIIQKFEETYPGVKVNLQINPKIGDIIRPQIVAGNVPDFISMNDNDQSGVVLSMIKEKGLTDLTDVFEGPGLENTAPLKDQVLGGVLNTAKCAPYGDDRIYLAPFNASPMGLVYNKALFEEKGWELPVTWDDFFALGDKAKEEGYALFTYAGIYPGYIESMLWPALASATGSIDKISSYTEGSFSTPEALQVLENIKRIADGGYLMEGTVALNHTQSQTDMMMNKALFIPNGNWMENEMKDAPRADGFQFGLCPAPVLKAGDERFVMTSVEQFSIPANAKNPELAKEFLRFLYTEYSIKLFAEKANGIYALKSATEQTKGIVSDGIFNMNEIYDDATSMVFGWDAMPEDSKVVIADYVFNVLSDVMSGSMSAQEWADGVEDAFQEINASK